MLINDVKHRVFRSTLVEDAEIRIPPIIYETNGKYVFIANFTTSTDAGMEMNDKGQVKMINIIEDKDWWADMHPRHQKKINTTFIVFSIFLIDLLLSIIGVSSLLHWGLDLLIIWGSFSVYMTVALLAIRYK